MCSVHTEVYVISTRVETVLARTDLPLCLQHSLRAAKPSRQARERIRDHVVAHPPLTQTASLLTLTCGGSSDQKGEKEPLLPDASGDA